MDARMQKHRITRWVGRLFAVLSLVASWSVQAAIESIPPIGTEWRSLFNPIPSCNSSYTSVEAAVQGTFSCMCQWINTLGWNVTSYTTPSTVFPDPSFSLYTILAEGWPADTIVGKIIFTEIGADGKPSGTAGNWIYNVKICPIPATYPSNQYKYVYDANTKVGMCVREVLCWLPNVLNSSGQCVPPTTLTITLSGGTEVEPSKGSDLKVLPIIATVLDQNTKQPPMSAVKVHISLKVEDPKSGGHAHGDSTRPRGSVADKQSCDPYGDGECWSNTTDGNGQVVFNFNAPEASGTHNISATCDGCTNTATKLMDVKVDGLEIIPDSTFYTFIGGEADKTHHDNHYLTPEATNVLRNIAISYRIEDKFWQLKRARRGKPGQYTYTPPSVLYVNDASLIWGGRFDVHGKWKGEHKGHRRGIVADIRANQININNGAIPLQSFANFQKMAKSYNAKAQVHCSDDGQDRQPPACIGNDGSQDEGRHFHVILIGGVDK